MAPKSGGYRGIMIIQKAGCRSFAELRRFVAVLTGHVDLIPSEKEARRTAGISVVTSSRPEDLETIHRLVICL